MSVPEIYRMFDRLRSRLVEPERQLALHRDAVRSLRDELATIGEPVFAVLTWGSVDDFEGENEIEIRLGLDEYGKADLAPELDRLFELSIAQALGQIGSLILTRPSRLQAVDSPPLTEWRGYELAAGIWRPTTCLPRGKKWALMN